MVRPGTRLAADAEASDSSSLDAIWRVLDTVMDPEVPVLSVVGLGIVREVVIDTKGRVVVSVTPTYSGCPAMRVIEAEIVDALTAAGWPDVEMRTIYSPPWTTDWIGPDARAKLREYGIAPPPGAAVSGQPSAASDHVTIPDLVPLTRRAAPVPCPYCGSSATSMRSEFGSTACKAIMFCAACRQPFELFKAI